MPRNPGNPREDYWSDEDHDTAVRMALEGYSRALIAQSLGKTRNGVVGRLWRAGIRETVTTIRMVCKRSARKNRPKPPKAKKPRPSKPTLTLMSEHEPLNLKLTDLGAHQCRWPVAYTSEHLFCGLKARGRYCEDHDAIAHVPPKKKAA